MRSICFRSAIVLAAFVPFAVLACTESSQDDDGNVTEQETVVRPDGSDLPGKFKVLTPTGAPTGVKVNIGSLSDAPGTEIGPLGVGTYTFSLVSAPLTTQGTATIAVNQLTTAQASLFAVDIKNTPQPTLGLTQRPKMQSPYVDLARLNANNTWSTVSSSTLPLISDGTSNLSLLPGRYRTAFGYDKADGQIFDVAAGETKSIKAWDYAERRVAKIVAPIREFPTASCALFSGQTLQEYRFMDQTNNIFMLADGESSPEIGRRSDSTLGYYFTIMGAYDGSSPVRVTLPLGEPGQGALSYQVGRLDVDDVAVLQGDGTTKMVRGTYTVHRKTGIDSAGKDVFSSSNTACGTSTAVPTHTGLDMPRGRYKVVVSYSTVEAGRKESVHVVDVE